NGAIDWTASANVSWLSLSPASASGPAFVAVTPNVSGLSVGDYSGTITLTAPNSSNSPTVSINLKIYQSGNTSQPFGEFSTPTNNSTVSSSIPVTGWVLDDVAVESVKIFREEGAGLTYIGDAVFVEGARPDVEQAFPGYPANYRAGWGYMLLTNFLPNNGNGTFTLHALAEDSEGNRVTLGTKTIIVNNTDAVKPFGAIDSPAQGGEASGTAFNNQGWVLTPLPNTIPVNGSTINVYVDGVLQGHPEYGLYRPDIAELFPDYANSNGALARFELDTMPLENSIHQIYWIAEDDAGNADGIGSRYFTVNNTGTSDNRQARTSAVLTARQMEDIPTDLFATIMVEKGYRKSEAVPVAADQQGVVRLKLKELQRVVCHLSCPMIEEAPNSTARRQRYTGYLQIGDQLRPLPIGSTLDRGIFYWQPGHGFIGTYHFVFIMENPDGGTSRKNIVVEIVPST
ncbi:MAG: BACON domain-containing protein, partial [bacterium]|nr:BACON domain-containing protein [bacterium]